MKLMKFVWRVVVLFLSLWTWVNRKIDLKSRDLTLPIHYTVVGHGSERNIIVYGTYHPLWALLSQQHQYHKCLRSQNCS